MGLALAGLMLALGVPGVAAAGSNHHGDHHSTTRTTSSTSTPPYRVQRGIAFNNPHTAPNAIRNRILGAINHTYKGQQIHIMTWNFHDAAITRALIKAHHRGATVKLIMSRSLSKGAPGANFRRLKGAIADNTGRKPSQRSWARTCTHACRAKGGYAMHAKWMTISRSGASKEIVMEGSANLTTSASSNQWNDWVTRVGDTKAFATYLKVFKQAAKGGSFAPVTVTSGKNKWWFAPRHDNLPASILSKTRCHGTSMHGGTTLIRIASDVVRGSYGETIARQVHRLAKQGCNVEMEYTIMSSEVHDMLGNVRLRHAVVDRNGDGVFDEYNHIKAFAILGHVGSVANAHIVFQGSANWSNIMHASDEQGAIMNSGPITRHYERWISARFASAQPARALAFRRVPGVDPYAKIPND